MTGITKDELMQMARDAGIQAGFDHEYRGCFEKMTIPEQENMTELEIFTNAILERAAEHFVNHKWMDVTTDDAAEEIRALKINTGD